jgi:phosphoenolpyruvate carboxykinase (ATP)
MVLQLSRDHIKSKSKGSTMANSFSLRGHGITVAEVHRNLSIGALYEDAIRYEENARIVDSGALATYSGIKTGRSPKDKRVAKHPNSEAEVWWGTVNIPIEPQTFAINRERARDYLNSRGHVYCVDGFAGWDRRYRLKVRVICSRPYHALFMRTMLVRPTKQELSEFGEPDVVIYNAGGFPANSLTASMGSKTSLQSVCSLQPKRCTISLVATRQRLRVRRSV